MTDCVLRDLLSDSRDGEWGKGEPARGLVRMAVIRGTDFACARQGEYEGVPVRFLEERHANRKRLKPFDILIETAGGTPSTPTGRTILLKPILFDRLGPDVTCASFARFLRVDPEKAEPEFVFWLLQYHYIARNLLQFHTQHTGVARFQFTTFAGSFRLNLPELKLQCRIASILGSYDDLIEVNRRRIATLEKIAQRLFEEWFVEFRFPRCDAIPRVDSPLGPMPEGWRVTRLKDVTSKIGSGATPTGGKEAYKTEGINLVRSLNVFDYAFDYSGLAAIDNDQARQLNNVTLQEGDVLLNITGASVARCCLVPPNILPARVNQHVAIIRADRNRIHPEFILDCINASINKRKLLSVAQGGATREALTKASIENFQIFVAPPEVMYRHAKVVAPLHHLRNILAEQNRNLRVQRDLLLPRLISGDLPISAAERELETAA